MSPDTGYTQNQQQTIAKQELQRAERNISAVKELAEKEDIHAEGIIVEGRPYETIVATAKDKNIDLIVLGSHGRTGISRFLMGSVTERVIGHAESAVLVVKAE
jgi:nucleotide-binding universal stress UspA family protein